MATSVTGGQESASKSPTSLSCQTLWVIMINRILILLFLSLFLYNKGRACSCEFTSYEFSLNQYDVATHVFIAEIKEENPESIVEEYPHEQSHLS